MSRCRICHKGEAETIWQPFGPGQASRGGFSALGWHYRGFPAIPVCRECKHLIEQNQPVTFRYRDCDFVLDGESPRRLE